MPPQSLSLDLLLASERLVSAPNSPDVLPREQREPPPKLPVEAQRAKEAVEQHEDAELTTGPTKSPAAAQPTHGQAEAPADGDTPHERAEQPQPTQTLGMRRRSTFLRKSINQAAILEREAKRLASIQLVAERLQTEHVRELHEMNNRRLRRFGCTLVVALHHHTKAKDGDVGDGSGQRRLVTMQDKMTFEQMHAWIEVCLGLPKGKGRALPIQYFDEFGRGVVITDRRIMQRWLDQLWTKHPPRLHVYDSEKLVVRTEDRITMVKEIFDTYDIDKNNAMSGLEVRNMLLDMNLDTTLGVAKEDIAAFVDDEFAKADSDHDGSLTFAEFVGYYNNLKDLVKDKLTKDNFHVHILRKYQEECVEGASYRRTLNEIVCNHGGLLTLDQSDHGESFQVEVRFAKECLSESNKLKWARVSTMLEHKVDYFSDHTEEVGEVCSPIVRIEFEGDRLELHAAYTVRIPHCFAADVEKDDIVVAYSTLSGNTWEEVDPEYFQFVPGNELLGTMPSLLVEMVDSGILCAFTRTGRLASQRVRCFGFLPPEIIPLETELLRLYVSRDLPSEFTMLQRHEEHERGKVCVVGCSEPFEVNLGGHIDLQVNQAQQERRGCEWTGETSFMDCEFDPEDFLESVARERASVDSEYEPPSAADTFGKVDVVIRTLQIKKTPPGSTPKRFNVTRKRTPNEYTFSIDAFVHAFPPPSAPRHVQVVTRTSTGMTVIWEPPSSWGGCALTFYEIEISEMNKRGVYAPWRQVLGDTRSKHADVPDGMISASRLTHRITGNIYACKLRMRAYNCGSAKPSEWSGEYVLASEKEEDGAIKTQAAARGMLVRRASRETGTTGAKNEGGAAVIVQEDIQAHAGKRHVMHTKMAGWSPFRTALGNFYLKMGVRGGVRGTLFDLTIDQVEALAKESLFDSAVTSRERPLESLATAACWVLSTLAHYADDTTGDWISYTNKIDGLVKMAADQDLQPEHTEIYMHNILMSLFDIYETLRQCEEGGFITRQLQYKYDKEVRRELRADFENRLERLKNMLATSVMQLVLLKRKGAGDMEKSIKEVQWLMRKSSHRSERRNSLANIDILEYVKIKHSQKLGERAGDDVKSMASSLTSLPRKVCITRLSATAIGTKGESTNESRALNVMQLVKMRRRFSALKKGLGTPSKPLDAVWIACSLPNGKPLVTQPLLFSYARVMEWQDKLEIPIPNAPLEPLRLNVSICDDKGEMGHFEAKLDADQGRAEGRAIGPRVGELYLSINYAVRSQ